MSIVRTKIFSKGVVANLLVMFILIIFSKYSFALRCGIYGGNVSGDTGFVDDTTVATSHVNVSSMYDTASEYLLLDANIFCTNTFSATPDSVKIKYPNFLQNASRFGVMRLVIGGVQVPSNPTDFSVFDRITGGAHSKTIRLYVSKTTNPIPSFSVSGNQTGMWAGIVADANAFLLSINMSKFRHIGGVMKEQSITFQLYADKLVKFVTSTCDVNKGAPINIDFGRIDKSLLTFYPESSTIAKQLAILDVTCGAGVSVGEVSFKLDATLDGQYIGSNKKYVGVAMFDSNNKLVIPGNVLSINMADSTNRISFLPMKTQNVDYTKIENGDLIASATLIFATP